MNVTLQDIYGMSIQDFAGVEINRYDRGIIQLRYDRIQDYDFAYESLEQVKPAGYRLLLESTDRGPYRHRLDKGRLKEENDHIFIILSDTAESIEDIYRVVELKEEPEMRLLLNLQKI